MTVESKEDRQVGKERQAEANLGQERLVEVHRFPEEPGSIDRRR